MNENIISDIAYDEYRFTTIGEFEDCIIRGGEIEFIWKDKQYSITDIDFKIGINEVHDIEKEMLYDTAQELLEYMLGDGRLGDVVTQLGVTHRTL